MRLAIELEREDDGRWIADVPALPGVMAYGETEPEAVRAAKALSLRALASMLEHGEAPDVGIVAFSVAPGPDERRRAAVARSFGLFRDLAPGRDLTDELIRERREEAARESA